MAPQIDTAQRRAEAIQREAEKLLDLLDPRIPSMAWHAENHKRQMKLAVIVAAFERLDRLREGVEG